MPTEVSGRQLAAALGCSSENVVRKALKAGKIKRLPSGRFDLEVCLQRLRATTDPMRTPAGKGAHQVRKGARSSAHLRPLVTTPAEAREAVTLIARVLAEEGIVQDGAPDLPAARLAETILKARDRDLRIAERRKILVSSIPMQQHYAKAFIGLKRTMQGMPARHTSEMAARLGCDPAALDRELQQMVHATLVEMSEPVAPAGLPSPPEREIDR